MEYTSLLDQIREGFTARGWPSSDLGVFRMEGEEGGGATPPAGDPPEAPPEGAPAADPFDDGQVQQFDRAYVEKLRQENAGHRTKAKQYEDVFGGYDDNDRAVILETFAELRANPEAGTARLEAIASDLRKQFPGQKTPTAEELADAQAEGDKPLTRAEMQKMLSERDEKAEIEKSTQAVIAEAEKLGYKPGTDLYRRMMWTAANVTDFDLDKAHEHLKAERQLVIDEFLAEREKDAAGAANGGPGGASTGKEKKIMTFGDAAEATHARLKRAQLGG